MLANGVQVTKDYPTEVRRIGALTARDHAAGQYALGDRVVAHVDGGWMEGHVVGTMGREYQVEFPNNRSTARFRLPSARSGRRGAEAPQRRAHQPAAAGWSEAMYVA